MSGQARAALDAQIRELTMERYLDGMRDVCFELIDEFEAHGRHDAAETAREALFAVEGARRPL
jgi:hypothetical protein